MTEQDVKFARLTKPRGDEVPRGARPGGKWEAYGHRVQGTVRSHWLRDGWRYIEPPILTEPTIVSSADAYGRWEAEHGG